MFHPVPAPAREDPSGGAVRFRPQVPAAVVLLFAGLLFPLAAAAQAVLTDLTDPVGDDDGPGSYVYPENGVFVPGSFDLTRFRVLDQGSTVRFEVRIAAPIQNPWGSPDGFSLQSVDIYIDRDGVPGSGSTEAPLGRNVTVASRTAWDRLVILAPAFDEFVSGVVDLDYNYQTAGVAASVNAADRALIVDVPKTLVGEPSPSWRYIVCMLGQDGFSPGRVRPVQYFANEWNFGGGADGDYDPNIIDLITSGGVDQHGMLSRFQAYGTTRAVLYATDNGVPPVIQPADPGGVEAHRPFPFFPGIQDEVIAGAWARYRVNGGPYRTVPLTWGGSDVYYGNVPGREVEEGTISYVLFATDGFDTTWAPADTTEPFVGNVGPDVSPPDPLYVQVEHPVIDPDVGGFLNRAYLFFQLPEPARVTVEVRARGGSTVRTLAADEDREEGGMYYQWDGRDESDQAVAAGVYTFRITAVDLADRTATAEDSVRVERGGTDRVLEVTLLFHFNQSLVPYARVADLACYRGLIETLRNHPQSHFPLHLSGTLVQSLLWFDPETIDLVREGVREGQFEIVGSTYAQNIMYSTRSDTLDFQQNEAQIRAHRELLERTFDVHPVTFWNAERVWTQNFVKLLRETGYRNVQIEGYMLDAAGATEDIHRTRTVSYGADTVNVITDDQSVIGPVDYGVDTGDFSYLLDYLDQAWRTDGEDRAVVGYHQDAEATGLWDWEQRSDPSQDWANLDALLTTLESDPRYRLVTYQEALAADPPSENLAHVPDAAATWMNRDDWFTVNASPAAESYRALFDAVRDTLNAVAAEIAAAPPADTAAASALLHHAWRTFVAHQYEFGVTGFTGLSSQFEMIRSARFAARAARHALTPQTSVYREDVDGDGLQDVVLTGPGDVAVLTPRGGRLLYWFDLDHGVELVGNENFMVYGEPWVDDAWRTPLIRGGQEAYPFQAGNPLLPEVFTWTFEVRRRALADSVGGAGDLGNVMETVTLLPDGVRFGAPVGSATLTKTVHLGDPGTIHAEYALTGASGPTTVRVESALSPALLDVTDAGRGSLVWWGNGSAEDFTPDVTGVLNRVTGDRVEIESSQSASVTGREVVFGRLLSHTFSVPDTPGATFTLTLHRTRDTATPVRLAAFTAQASEGGITLSWAVPDGEAAAGFHVWRTAAAGDAARLTEQPIVCAGRCAWTDRDVRPGTLYRYRLEALGRDGGRSWFGPVEARAAAPSAVLRPPVPNPARGRVEASFRLPPRAGNAPAPYRLVVYDAGGREVRVLAEGTWGPEPADLTASWDGRDEAGRPVPAGVYFLELAAGETGAARKLVRIP
jgi:hypothetical protein